MAKAVPTPTTPTRARMRVRRNPRWLAVGVVAIVVGGLGSAYGFATVADSQPVIKVNRTIYRGERISAQDLTVINIGRGSDVPTISGNQLNDVIGKSAITDLAAGSLLVTGTVGQVDLASGMAQVGLKLAPGRLPSSGMVAGTKVLVVGIAAPQSTAEKTELPTSIKATLTSTPIVAADGSTIVDINVAADDAETVARLAAADRIVLVRQAER